MQKVITYIVARFAGWGAWDAMPSFSFSPKKKSLAKEKCFILLFLSVVVNAQQFEYQTQTQNMITIGEAFLQTENTEKALQIFQEALDVAETPEDKWLATDNLARLYASEEEYKKALECYDKLLLDDDVQLNDRVRAEVYNGLGLVYYDTKDYIHSIKSYTLAEELLQRSGYEEFKPILYCNIAKTLTQAGNIARAEALLDSVETSYPNTEDTGVIFVEIYQAKALLYSKAEDYKRAFEYMQKSAELRSQLGRQEINDILNRTNPLAMQKKVEATLKTEKKMRQLEAQIDQEQQINRRLGFVSYFVGVLVLFMFCAIVFFILLLRRRNNEKQQLIASNAEQQRIMSIIGHDFINPFNALIGFTELQMQYSANQNDSEMLEYSRQVYRSTQTLYEYFYNILAWSKISGRLTARKTRFNVNNEIEAVINACRLMAQEKGVRINLSVDANLQILADQNHLGIILRNIVSNSLKFTQSGGRVTISAYTFKGKTSITVEDTGVGMSEAAIQKVLSGGQVESKPGTNSEKGIGLGLRIVHDMVRANGGKMEITSTLGQGTTINLVFDNNQEAVTEDEE